MLSVIEDENTSFVLLKNIKKKTNIINELSTIASYRYINIL